MTDQIIAMQHAREAIEQLIACHDEPTCPAIDLGKKAIASIDVFLHWSDCAVNNGPALPPGPCDCGGLPAKPAFALGDFERSVLADIKSFYKAEEK